METIQEQIKNLLSNPLNLKKKKPFTRGCDNVYFPSQCSYRYITDTVDAQLPKFKRQEVPQEQFMKELEASCHDVLIDENIPSLCMKLGDGSFQDIKFERTSIPFQKIIKNKQVMHLCGNNLSFTLNNTDPSEVQQKNFIEFKQYWALRNQDGMFKKMVDTQLSLGDAGLLYYFDYKGRIKSRILSFSDGYVLCSHNDQNGDRILESVYYKKDDIEYIDSYDDTYMYRWKNVDESGERELNGWILEEPVKHGFLEIPLITKRGEVAWNNVQNIITSYEILYNIFNAIQRRYGWGILYVKGKFGTKGEKLAGNVILNDSSIDGNGDAKFLTPPTPQNTIDTLDLLEQTIQKGSGTTFILPKDISLSGDVSAIAIMIAQSLDIETALRNSIDWQNVIDKMVRLFSFGLSKELVNYGINKRALTEYLNMNISAKIKIWRPMNDYEYNQMLTILTGAGVLSKESAIELNTVSKPDEKKRIQKELEDNKETTGLIYETSSFNNLTQKTLETKGGNGTEIITKTQE